MKAFSGKGWRRAAPGFGNPEDAPPDGDIQHVEKAPKMLVGNLATDVAPETMREILEAHIDGLHVDVPGELVAIHVAVFGPARWGRTCALFGNRLAFSSAFFLSHARVVRCSAARDVRTHCL